MSAVFDEPTVQTDPAQPDLSQPDEAPPAAAVSVRGAAAAPHEDRVHRLLGGLKRKYGGRITGELAMPAQAARFAALPEALHPRLRAALAARGLTRLYAHQRAAWERVQAGEQLVVATPKASGKTLCYNLPVLDAVLSRQAKALYLFPTKALAQDQVAELSELNQALAGRGDGAADRTGDGGAPGGSLGGSLGIKAFTFDGDTPGDARKAVRTRGDIVLSNPDMLHQGILPHHTKWAQFFESLQFVVVDELHGYRCVFGSHVGLDHGLVQYLA